MPSRRGFTLIEIVVVIAVGAVLLSLPVTAFGGIRSGFAVREARSSFAALHARTRAQAIEFGGTLEFHVDAAGDSAWIARNDTTLETLRLSGELGVRLEGGPNPLTLCMNSRGYGDSGCSSFDSPRTFLFVQAADTARVELLPLGQLR